MSVYSLETGRSFTHQTRLRNRSTWSNPVKFGDTTGPSTATPIYSTSLGLATGSVAPRWPGSRNTTARGFRRKLRRLGRSRRGNSRISRRPRRSGDSTSRIRHLPAPSGMGQRGRHGFDDCRSRLVKTLLRFSKSAAAKKIPEGVVLKITHAQLAQAVGAARKPSAFASPSFGKSKSCGPGAISYPLTRRNLKKWIATMARPESRCLTRICEAEPNPGHVQPQSGLPNGCDPRPCAGTGRRRTTPEAADFRWPGCFAATQSPETSLRLRCSAARPPNPAGILRGCAAPRRGVVGRCVRKQQSTNSSPPYRAATSIRRMLAVITLPGDLKQLIADLVAVACR